MPALEQRDRLVVRASLLEAQEPHFIGEHPAGVCLARHLTQLAALEEELFCLVEQPGNHGPGGPDIAHPPPECRLAEASRQPIGDVEAPVCLLHISSFECRPPPQEVGFGHEGGIGDGLDDTEEFCRVGQTLPQQFGDAGGEVPGEQHASQDGGVVQGTGEVEGLVAQGQAAAPVAGEDEFHAEGRQQAGPGPRVLIADRADGGLEQGHPLGVDPPEDARQQAAGVGQSGPDQGRHVLPVPGQLGRLEERLAVGGVTRSPLGLPERDQQLQALGLVHRPLRHRLELESLAVVGHRFVVGELGQGAIAGVGGVTHRLAGLRVGGGGAGVVVREGGQMVLQPPSVDLLDGLGHPAVKCDPAGAGELAVERVAHQRVGELTTRPGPGDVGHQPGRQRLVDHRGQAFLAQTRGGTENGQIELEADDGRQTQDAVGLRREPGEPAPDHVPNPFGDAQVFNGKRDDPPAVAAVDATGLCQVANDLDHEEGVALGLLVDGGGEEGGRFLVEVVARRLLDEGQHPGLVEAREGQAFESGQPAKVGQCPAEGMVPADLGVPVGADDQQTHGFGGTGHVAEQQERGLGRPLEVVEDEQDGMLPGSGGEPARHPVEEPVALRLGIGAERRWKSGDPVRQLRHQAGQLAWVSAQPGGQLVDGGVVDQVAQRFDKGLVRHAEVLTARPGQHGGVLAVDLTGQLRRQAGLAHPGLPGQKRDALLSGRRLLPQLVEALELAFPAHEDPQRSSEQRRERHRRILQRGPLHAGRRSTGSGMPFRS